MTPKKERQTPQRSSRRLSQEGVGDVGDRIARPQIFNSSSGAAMAPGSCYLQQPPFAPPPKVDTDRRNIEALNEDKSRTTKEELDDIKHTHYKEKKKKEQHDMETPNRSVVSKKTELRFYCLN